VLPEGISPGDVQFEEGPKGWKFTANDDGYTVKGPAVPVGENATYSVTVRQLPDAKELPFKTLQTYSDGRIDRWIELGETHGAGHGSPAPTLKLKAASPGASPSSPAGDKSAAPAPSSEDAKSPSSAAPAAKEGGGLPTTAWVGIGAAVVLVLGAGGYVIRRRTGAHE